MRSITTIRTAIAAATLLAATAATASAQGPTTYARAEALGWQIQDSPLRNPLLVSLADSTILLGDEDIRLPFQYGGRATLGTWFDEADTIGVDGSFLFIVRNWAKRSFSDPTGTGRLAMPYIDGNSGLGAVHPLSGPSFFTPDQIVIGPDEQPVVIPGINIPGSSARVRLATRTELLGFDGNGLMAAVVGMYRAELFVGVRYLRIAEDMILQTFTNPITAPGSSTTTDSFKTRNNFYGGQAGARLMFDTGDYFGELTGKVGAGPMVQQTIIAGSYQTTAFDPAGSTPTTFPGGIYTQRSNIGTRTRTRFAVVSEAQANAGIRFGGISVFAGYSILYVSSVARPGNQIDPLINPNQSEAILQTAGPPGIGAGPASPARSVNASSFWAQGVSLGIELRY